MFPLYPRLKGLNVVFPRKRRYAHNLVGMISGTGRKRV
jgi:hypothetical protein